MWRIATVVLVALSLATAGCNPEMAEEGPTPEEQDKLEQAWANAGKSDLSWCGTKYDSEYVNMGLSGRFLQDGAKSETFSLFAGWHSDDFPWPNAQSWVSIGLRVGSDGYNYVAYHSRDFEISLPTEHSGTFTVRFQGVMERAGTGERVPVAFSMTLDITPMEQWRLGIGDLGMRYRPSMLKALSDTATTSITVGDSNHTIEPASLIGEVERGEVNNINYRGMFFKYEYCSLSNPDAGKLFTTFTTRTLTEEGNPVLKKASDLYAATGAKAFTFDREKDYGSRDLCEAGCDPNWMYMSNGPVTPDNPEGLSCPKYGHEGVLFEHIVDLGTHGTLKRQMFRTYSINGEAYIGLREIFLAKTNVWGFPCRKPYCGDVPATE